MSYHSNITRRGGEVACRAMIEAFAGNINGARLFAATAAFAVEASSCSPARDFDQVDVTRATGIVPSIRFLRDLAKHLNACADALEATPAGAQDHGA